VLKLRPSARCINQVTLSNIMSGIRNQCKNINHVVVIQLRDILETEAVKLEAVFLNRKVALMGI
jgi:hypothetical protein